MVGQNTVLQIWILIPNLGPDPDPEGSIESESGRIRICAVTLFPSIYSAVSCHQKFTFKIHELVLLSIKYSTRYLLPGTGTIPH